MISHIVQLNSLIMSLDIDSVSKVVMIWKKSCLLLCREDGKGWELPGGHLNRGENYVKGAIREVFEETGINISKIKLIFKDKDYRLFVCKPRTVSVKLSREHTDYKWVNRSQLLKTNITSHTKKNIKHILNVL